MDGFVHNAEGLCKELRGPWRRWQLRRHLHRSDGPSAPWGITTRAFSTTTTTWHRSLRVSDRWFSPVSTKSIGNRIATFTGGTTQGLVKDPGGDDHLSQLDIPNIFQELDQAKVSWKIYYTVTEGFCLSPTMTAPARRTPQYPATDFLQPDLFVSLFV